MWGVLIVTADIHIHPSIWDDRNWQLAQSPLLKRLPWSVWEADNGSYYRHWKTFVPTLNALNHRHLLSLRIKCNYTKFTRISASGWKNQLAATQDSLLTVNQVQVRVKRKCTKTWFRFDHNISRTTITPLPFVSVRELRPGEAACCVSGCLGGSEHLCRYG